MNLNEKAKRKSTKRRSRKPKVTYTTGDIALNIKRFNQAMGTDFNNPSTEEAKDAANEVNSLINGGMSTEGGNADVGEIVEGSNEAGTDFDGGEGMGEAMFSKKDLSILKEEIEAPKDSVIQFPVYRGTTRNAGYGNPELIWFAKDFEEAKGYSAEKENGRVQKAYINLKNPLIIKDQGEDLGYFDPEKDQQFKGYKVINKDPDTLDADKYQVLDEYHFNKTALDLFKLIGINQEVVLDEMIKFYNADTHEDFYSFDDMAIYELWQSKLIRDKIKAAGYDGIKTNEFLEFPSTAVKDIYAVFSEDQVIEIEADYKESLTEAKREVRRYYIRPQNIFCANKAEVIKALIDIDDQNCSVYTLKNLGDNKDIHRLTNNDIIYYYDDQVLYDKNHVKVMDYDLYIKHEEERKKFNRDIDEVPTDVFQDEYEDRLTHATEFEESLTEDTHAQFAKPEGDKVASYNNALKYAKQYNVPFIYGYTNKAQGYKFFALDTPIKCNGDMSKCEQDFRHKYKACSIVYVAYPDKGFIEQLDEIQNELDLDFDDIDAYGVNLSEDLENEEEHTCCICGETFKGYGNNPDPVKSDGVCCDACNAKFVIPARLSQYFNSNK